MANVSWSASIQVAGGATVSVSQDPIAAEATDRIEVSIAVGEVDKEVSLQPGSAGEVHLLLIKSNQYGNGTDITFKVSNGVTDGSAIRLIGPQFYTGGAVLLFGLDPKSVKFTNNSAKSAQVEIFIARDATP